jgi:hypothetical protein
MERAGARAVCFPMHEPGGYPPANDEALAAAAASGGRPVSFCRVDPHREALAEARRCLDAGTLAGEEHADAGPPPGPAGPLDPAIERVCSHLLTAMGRVMAEGEMTESIALARPPLPRSAQLVTAALGVARTPDVALPEPAAPEP